MNAAVASGIPAADYGRLADTVQICFSKGLGCAMGAILAGSDERIEEAWRLKFLFGGALRQAGVVAAGMVYAFDHNVERLAEDHARAKRLAAGLAALDCRRRRRDRDELRRHRRRLVKHRRRGRPGPHPSEGVLVDHLAPASCACHHLASSAATSTRRSAHPQGARVPAAARAPGEICSAARALPAAVCRRPSTAAERRRLEGFGQDRREGRDATTDTQFRISSITKTPPRRR